MAAASNRPFLPASYLSLAFQLHETVPDLSVGDARSRLVAALMDPEKIRVGEVGRRNSSADQQIIQTIHDHSASLGAKCMESDADEMMEAYRERYISDKAREEMDDSDFAGKDKSFPIKTQADVDAAFHSLGRAGSDNYSTDKIRANIIRIAKRKGLSLPKSAQESSITSAPGNLKLVESQAFSVDIPLSEAFSTGNKIKLIAPGKGSSAWYTEAVLKKAVTDKIFHAGLPMRIDHPTQADMAARPEGSVKDWGAVLAHDAEWLESYVGKDGKDRGAGLYSAIKPFSDHADLIKEKGPYAGVSISASGDAVMESGRVVKRDGVPVLKEFTSAEGADMVTRAGAGGLFLSEAARPQSQEVTMTEAEIKTLVEESVTAAVKAALTESAKAPNPSVAALEARAIRGDAREEATRILKSVSLSEKAKALVIEDVLGRDIPIKDGVLDKEKFTESVNARAQAIGAVMSDGGRVTGMGAAAPVQIDAKEAERVAAREKEDLEASIKVYESLGLDRKAAEFAAKGRAA